MLFDNPIELGAAILAGIFLRELYDRFRGAEKRQSDLMTRGECDKNRKECPTSRTTADLDVFKKEMRESLGMIKGVLLAIAAKANVPISDYEDLVK